MAYSSWKAFSPLVFLISRSPGNKQYLTLVYNYSFVPLSLAPEASRREHTHTGMYTCACVCVCVCVCVTSQHLLSCIHARYYSKTFISIKWINPPNNSWYKYSCYSQFIDEQNGAQRGWVSRSKSHSSYTVVGKYHM